MIYRFFSGKEPVKARDLLKALLTTRVLRPSRIYDFNDHFECKFVLNVDGPDEIRRARYFADNAGATDDDCESWLQGLSRTWHVEQETRAALLQRVGVVCFTRDWNHHLFWSHYASHHTGFCIGLDEAVLEQFGSAAGFGDVVYSDQAPEFKFFSDPQDAFYRKAVFTKASCWEYEREVRMTFDGFEDHVLPEGAIREVILGCRSASELRDFARFAKFDGVEFYQVSEVLREYRLQRHPVDPRFFGSMTSHF
jgi:hypothetical protein